MRGVFSAAQGVYACQPLTLLTDVSAPTPRTIALTSGQLTITDCLLADSEDFGIFAEAGATVVSSGLTFANNAQGDAQLP